MRYGSKDYHYGVIVNEPDDTGTSPFFEKLGRRSEKERYSLSKKFHLEVALGNNLDLLGEIIFA
jgi:hypothetical protein